MKFLFITKELSNLLKRKLSLIINLLIMCVAITIIVLLILLLFRKEQQHVKIGDLAMVELSFFDNKTNTLENETNSLEEIIAANMESMVLFLEITDCGSCISKGLRELKKLRKAGKACFVVIIYDWIDELKNWTVNYDIDSIFTVRKDNFNSHIYTPILPVLVRFREYTVHSYKFITQ